MTKLAPVTQCSRLRVRQPRHGSSCPNARPKTVQSSAKPLLHLLRHASTAPMHPASGPASPAAALHQHRADRANG